MYYANGDIYEGEWLDDMRHGKGMLRLANSNRYEGEWKLDKKNGEGKFFFLKKGQMLQGYWVEDINKTGQIIDFDRENATDATPYLLPSVSITLLCFLVLIGYLYVKFIFILGSFKRFRKSY
jgi:hypothetical protein